MLNEHAPRLDAAAGTATMPMMGTMSEDAIVAPIAAIASEWSDHAPKGGGVTPRAIAGAVMLPHVLRLALRHADPDLIAQGYETPLDREGVRLSQSGERLEVAGRLRRALPEIDREWQEAARLTAGWLSKPASEAWASAGNLARVLSGRHLAVKAVHYHLGWMSVAGPHYLAMLRREPTEGGPVPTAIRDHLQPIVRSCWATGLWNKSSLAEAAGISRQTLAKWVTPR